MAAFTGVQIATPNATAPMGGPVNPDKTSPEAVVEDETSPEAVVEVAEICSRHLSLSGLGPNAISGSQWVSRPIQRAPVPKEAGAVFYLRTATKSVAFVTRAYADEPARCLTFGNLKPGTETTVQRLFAERFPEAIRVDQGSGWRAVYKLGSDVALIIRNNRVKPAEKDPDDGGISIQVIRYKSMTARDAGLDQELSANFRRSEN